MMELYDFVRPQLSSKSRPMMSPVTDSSPQHRAVPPASTTAVGGCSSSNSATVRRFWPSYIDQHVAQLDFDASVMMMTSAGDECNNDDDEDQDGDDDDDEDRDGDDVQQQQQGQQQGQRRNDNGDMARGGGAQENNIFDSNSGGSNNSSMVMAMMMLDAAAGAAVAADSAQLISTDSLDMEQLRVRCECTKHNENYKLTFDEDSGQWTTSGIGGSFTTTATASPPVVMAQQNKQKHQQNQQQRRMMKQQQHQHQNKLKQLLVLNQHNNNNNNNNDDEDGQEEEEDGHDDERHQHQLYTTALMEDNNGGLGLRLLEQLNNDDDDYRNGGGRNMFNMYRNAEKRWGGGRPATSVGHGTTPTAGWRKNSFMVDDELLNNQNNNGNDGTFFSSSSSASKKCHQHGAVAATTGGGGRGAEMMTTWGRLQQGDDMGTQQPYNSEKVHSLPELNSTNNPSIRRQQHQQQVFPNDGTVNTPTTTFAKSASSSSSTPAMATQQQHVQAVHGALVQPSSRNAASANDDAHGTTNRSSSSNSGTSLRRPTSSLVDNFIAGQRQQQNAGGGGGGSPTDYYVYSETYLGNGRYIDMNENEIGYVPSCTASIQRSGGGGGSSSGGGGDGRGVVVGDPNHHHHQLLPLDLNLHRRELLGEDDDAGGLANGEQQQRQHFLLNATTTTTAKMAPPIAMKTMPLKMFSNDNNQQRQKLYEMGGDGTTTKTAPTPMKTTTMASSSSNNCNGRGSNGGSATPSMVLHHQNQRRTFADLSASRTVPDLKFIALAHNVPSICPPSSVSLDNLLCRVRNSGSAGDGTGATNAIDELIDCCASSMRIISEADGGANDGPDSGLGSSHSDGPSHIEDWSSLSILLPRNVLEACSFFKTNSFLLTGSSNNIEGRRPAVPPPRSFTSAAIWRLKEKDNKCCLRHPFSACTRCCANITDPSTPTCTTASEAAAASCSCCCCAGGVGSGACAIYGTDAHLRLWHHNQAAEQEGQCTKSAVFVRQHEVVSHSSRAVLSQKLRLHARELALIGLPIYDQKRAIIERVVEGVAELVRGASSVVLMKALERLLGDELLPGVRMWHVICTVTGPGPVTRNVYQLIQQLEASEKPDHSRVGHFFRGLLTLHSLDGWLSYVVLKEHVLRPFYAPSAFLIGAQTAYRSLYCRLIECVELLSVLNQCGEAGKRWERRRQQKQKLQRAATTTANINHVHDNDGDTSPGVDSANATNFWGGAARLPKDSRVPKSSSVPTKLMTSAAMTTTITMRQQNDAAAAHRIDEEEEEREHEQQEVEAVQWDQAEQQQQCCVSLEDVKFVEMVDEKEVEKTVDHARYSMTVLQLNNNPSNSTPLPSDDTTAVVHAILRPSRIPILRTRSRSSTMHSNGTEIIHLHPHTLSRRSSSARPTPPSASNSSSPSICICSVRETVAGDTNVEQLPHGAGGTLLPLRKGECVRVLSIRGEYTRCSRLPEQQQLLHHQQRQRQQRLALQNGVVPTRTLQLGDIGGAEQRRRHDDESGCGGGPAVVNGGTAMMRN